MLRDFMTASGRGMEGICVRVYDFEACGGSLRFCARDVIDLDAQEAVPGGQEFVRRCRIP